LLPPLVLLSCLALGLSASAPAKPRGPIVLAGGWQFKLDPANIGLNAGWQRPDVGFPADRLARTGASLADQGIPEYKGYSWFRTSVTVPDGWQRVLLGFGAVDVGAQVYVDGALVGAFEDASLGSKAALLDLTGRAVPGQSILLALRVRGEGGFGGIKQDVRLGDDESQVMTGFQYGLWLHNNHPDWRLLPWMAGGRRAWTVVGLEGAKARAVVASDGSLSPWASGFSISFWLFDRASRQLVTFGSPRTELVEGSLPLPVLTFESGPWRLREEVLPDGEPAHPSVAARITLLAAPGPVDLYVAARPYTASGGLAPIRHASVASGVVRLNSQPAVALQAASYVEGGALAGGDASAVAAAGALPAASSAQSAAGGAEALLRVPLALDTPVAILAPSVPGEGVPAMVDPAMVASTWRTRLHQVELELPDSRLEHAFYASLGYILESESRGQIHPGPLLHDAFWVRDAAMIGYALERAGLADAVRGSAEAVLNAIGPNGQVNAITDPNGQPRANVEWDAPGEAAFTLVEYARWSGDTEFSRRAYPRALAALRHALQARDSGGLLPANESAEDLGPASQRHYWDHLWLLTGLMDARFAASQLGDDTGAAELSQAFDQVRTSVLASIASTGSEVIPNGPEDLTSSAMARGSTPALWPLPVLDGSSPLVRRSFEAYYERFMKDGAFRHLYGQWWPYGGLEVAHALLFLGDRGSVQQTLAYTLDHQTFPGLYAWAEGVDSATSDFAEGDMPHAWASAELVNLVRDMLLFEDGDLLVVGAGVPESWAGKPFAIRHAPTRWGSVDLTVSAAGEVQVAGAQPPGGLELRLPFPARVAPTP
jgi:hypothetical protein